MPDKECLPLHVLIVGASLRRNSLNNQLAGLAASAVKNDGATVDLTTIADFDCPFYDGDVEAESGIPDGAKEFCRRLKKSDALMISSPEYNASFSGALKNLIDWVSRFRPQPFNGKQVLLMSASPAMAGGNRGVWSLRNDSLIPEEEKPTRCEQGGDESLLHECRLLDRPPDPVAACAASGSTDASARGPR